MLLQLHLSIMLQLLLSLMLQLQISIYVAAVAVINVAAVALMADQYSTRVGLMKENQKSIFKVVQDFDL